MVKANDGLGFERRDAGLAEGILLYPLLRTMFIGVFLRNWSI